jgi:hypothetical protein
MLEAFAAWLGKSPLTAFLENTAWAVPAIQTLHIFCIAIVFGGAAIVNLRVLGVVERDQPMASVLDRFLPPIGWAVLVLLITGALLIASEPNRALFRTVFWVKMGLVGIGVLATFAQRRAVGVGAAWAPDAAPPQLFRLLSLMTLAIWVAVIFTGRWIGYVSGWPGSPA